MVIGSYASNAYSNYAQFNMPAAMRTGAALTQGQQQNAPAPQMLPSIYRNSANGESQGRLFRSIDGDSVELSGRKMPGSGLLKSLEPEGECETCANRKYVDGSNDPSVSYQSPTKISPGMAGAAVAAHEQEHVRNEQANAQREGREVVSQTVTLKYDTCPECGRTYVSGGTTRTTTAGKKETPEPAAVNNNNNGSSLDMIA